MMFSRSTHLQCIPTPLRMKHFHSVIKSHGTKYTLIGYKLDITFVFHLLNTIDIATLPDYKQAYRAIQMFKDEYLLDYINVEELGMHDEEVDERDPKVWSILGKRIYGKLFADRGYISPSLFEALFADGVHLVTGIRSNMKNKLMPLWDKIMLRKRYIIECINHLLKDKGNLVHSRHRSVNNFLMNLIAAISAYCFFDNKPEAIKGYCVEDYKQLTLF